MVLNNQGVNKEIIEKNKKKNLRQIEMETNWFKIFETQQKQF